MVKKIEHAKHFITGGAGFIGSHLAERLVSSDNEVTVYDKIVSGNKDNIKHLLGKPNFTFIEDDLLNSSKLNASMKGHDIIWHLGANTDIRKGNRIVDLDLQNCTVATLNVLEAMRANKIDKVLFASSATVYGDSPRMNLSETYGPLLPISLYGAGKLACEGLFSAYSHLFDIRAWVFRFANVVGDRMEHGVIYDFIQKLRSNRRELEILGDGNQEKPYFLVEDCLDGMMVAYLNSDARCEIYNLGCASFTKVTRVAEIVVEEVGLKNVTFKFTGGDRGWPGDVPTVHYDLEKMRKLGWQARYSSDEAVRLATRRLLV